MTKWDFSFAIDNEWYTYKKDVREFLILSKITKDKIIWLPFDTEESAFYIVLKELGYKFIHSHISIGKDFYDYEPREHYDLILSNPPFKNKVNLLIRLKELNKPFALIFGTQCFNSGGFTRLLNTIPNLEMVFMVRRLKFHKGIENEKKDKAGNFHSIWLCSNIIGQAITIFDNKNTPL